MNTDNMQPVETLKGIGEKTAKLFEKVGVRTVDDLLHYYPRGYDTFEEPKPMGALEVCLILREMDVLDGKIIFCQLIGNPEPCRKIILFHDPEA